jgi:hypothetical protein
VRRIGFDFPVAWSCSVPPSRIRGSIEKRLCIDSRDRSNGEERGGKQRRERWKERMGLARFSITPSGVPRIPESAEHPHAWKERMTSLEPRIHGTRMAWHSLPGGGRAILMVPSICTRFATVLTLFHVSDYGAWWFPITACLSFPAPHWWRRPIDSPLQIGRLRRPSRAR